MLESGRSTAIYESPRAAFALNHSPIQKHACSICGSTSGRWSGTSPSFAWKTQPLPQTIIQSYPTPDIPLSLSYQTCRALSSRTTLRKRPTSSSSKRSRSSTSFPSLPSKCSLKSLPSLSSPLSLCSRFSSSLLRCRHCSVLARSLSTFRLRTAIICYSLTSFLAICSSSPQSPTLRIRSFSSPALLSPSSRNSPVPVASTPARTASAPLAASTLACSSPISRSASAIWAASQTWTCVYLMRKLRLEFRAQRRSQGMRHLSSSRSKCGSQHSKETSLCQRTPSPHESCWACGEYS